MQHFVHTWPGDRHQHLERSNDNIQNMIILHVLCVSLTSQTNSLNFCQTDEIMENSEQLSPLLTASLAFFLLVSFSTKL